jgi:hypothetical protein
LIPFLQARRTSTPRPWIKAARKRRLEARGEDKAGRWDAVAGSQASSKSCTCDIFDRAHKLGTTLPSALPHATASALSHAAVEEEADSENEDIEESMIQERANDMSRFESSRVEMRDKDTLVVIAFDGSKEFFKRAEQTTMDTKTGVPAPALEGAFSSPSFPS